MVTWIPMTFQSIYIPHHISKKQKTFSVFPYRVIERLVEVWENEKLKWEFSQTFTSVSITYRNTVKTVFYFFYKITPRKLNLKGG